MSWEICWIFCLMVKYVKWWDWEMTLYVRLTNSIHPINQMPISTLFYQIDGSAKHTPMVLFNVWFKKCFTVEMWKYFLRWKYSFSRYVRTGCLKQHTIHHTKFHLNKSKQSARVKKKSVSNVAYVDILSLKS